MRERTSMTESLGEAKPRTTMGDVVIGVGTEVGGLLRKCPASKRRPTMTYSALAFLFLLTGFLFVTLSLLDLVAFAFKGNSYAWMLAFLIIGIVWFAVGAVFAIGASLKEDHVASREEQGGLGRAA
jgi:hypothetical protein